MNDVTKDEASCNGRRFAAIPVSHPLGVFYLTAIPAAILLKVCFSSPHRRVAAGTDGHVSDWGHQRRLDDRRLDAISRYLQTRDATLPGTIILAANCCDDGLSIDLNSESAYKRWRINREGAGDESVYLEIPTLEKVAAIVDGQHRLRGFEGLSDELCEMRLPCSIFLDLPTAQQASIFATINFNQKPVSKSQTYELFGYNLDEEPEKAWSPDKLAVNFARRLNVDEMSAFKNHIKVAAIDDRVLDEISKIERSEWTVSTATIVEGVLSLITNDQKRDRDILNRYLVADRDRKVLMRHVEYKRGTPPPFWDLYINGNQDVVMYKTLLNYFEVVGNLFWSNPRNVVLRKTAGIQALFRVLKILLPEQIEQKSLSKEVWRRYLDRAMGIDFGDAYFTESSGKGRSRIQDAFLVAVGKRVLTDIRDKEFQEHLGEMLKLERNDVEKS